MQEQSLNEKVVLVCHWDAQIVEVGILHGVKVMPVRWSEIRLK